MTYKIDEIEFQRIKESMRCNIEMKKELRKMFQELTDSDAHNHLTTKIVELITTLENLQSQHDKQLIK